MNKFTHAQLTEIKALKSIDELKSFLTKENITLTDEEMVKASKHFKSGKSELTDDELDMIAGGYGKPDYAAQAKADGRTIHQIPNDGETSTLSSFFTNHFCDCFLEEVWAKSKTQVIESGVIYRHLHDCKCYTCGKEKILHIVWVGNEWGFNNE